MKKTMYQKIWDDHIVHIEDGEGTILYVDRQLLHEVTSPQAFEGLRLTNRKVRNPEKTFATMDHNVSTKTRDINAVDEDSRIQMQTLSKNCKQFNIKCFGFDHPDQGVVHVFAPELGISLPGTVMVCGDSHTATHGAFGALAFGIGTSEVEHVLATQTIIQKKSKTMLIKIDGELGECVTAKDVILYIIGKIGTAGATGYIIEYAGEIFKNMSMEERMTVCNMSIEAGARAGMIAPDEVTFEYLKGKDYSPKGDDWNKAVDYWKTLKSDESAEFDKIIYISAEKIKPQVTWGTSPGQVISIEENIPDLKNLIGNEKYETEVALKYMDLRPNQPIKNLPIDKVFIGSCTNGRIEDLRAAAKILKGKKISDNVEVLIVPGSGRVKRQAEKEGLDKIFIEAGCQWRHPGCSMCLAMNDDKLKEGERCASTSNRNFVGRQGKGSRTHLVSPIMAVAAAITGTITDVRKL